MRFKPGSSDDEFECSGSFDENVCSLCTDYEKCKALEQDFAEDYERSDE